MRRAWALTWLLFGCSTSSVEITADSRSGALKSATPSVETTTLATAPRRPPELVEVGADVQNGREFVSAELSRADEEGMKLVVYVGATWCEPCQRFHKAVEEGKLDDRLPNVRFLVFDHDVHERLLGDSDMQCTSRLVPLFSRPNTDGTCSDRRTEGAVKGERAVGVIMPRLEAILQ